MKRVLSLSVLLFVLPGILPAYGAGKAAAQAGASTVEAEGLRAVIRDPAGPLPPFRYDGVPDPAIRELFDRALAACRQFLKGNPGNAAARANLGTLYLLRDRFHPGESGGFVKAIDHFLITLRDDPVNPVALARLGDYEVFSRIPSVLPRETSVAVERALGNSLGKEPRNPGALRALAGYLLFLGRVADALPLANTLALAAPDRFSSHLLNAAAELKTGGHPRARIAFDAALEHATDNTGKATATLGLAQLLVAQGEPGAASALYAEATRLLPGGSLERSARAAGLDSPDELGQAMGKAFALRGDPARAVEYLSMRDILKIRSMRATEKNGEGVKRYRAGDLEGARLAFVETVQLGSPEAVDWRNLAGTSYRLGRYRDSIWAYRKARALEPPGMTEVHEMAVAFAVLGDYRSAREHLEKGVRDYPESDGMKAWAVIMAYCDGGWDAALESRSSLGRPQPGRTTADLYEMFDYCLGGVRDLAGRAEAPGMRYHALRLESLLYRVLGEGLSRRLLSASGRREIRKEREAVFARIVDIYRHLPLKPALPAEAHGFAIQGKASLDSDDRKGATERYLHAREIAPWWADGRYILALLASNDPSTDSFEKYASYDRGTGRYPFAVEEIDAYLELVPDGPEAPKARKLKAGWLVEGPWSRPGKDVE